MTRIPEDEVPEDGWVAPLITVAAAMLCIGIGWMSLLFLHFPSLRAIGGLALAGFVGYGVLNGLNRLSRRSGWAAVVAELCIIGATVFAWPVTCTELSGKLGAPIKHYCTCAGLTVKDWGQGGLKRVSHPTITTYCIGWETEDVWEERRDLKILN